MTVRELTDLRVTSSHGGGRIRALLAADRAYHRARWSRQVGVTALAASGSAAWMAPNAGGDAVRRLVFAAWLAFLLFTVGAVIAEVSAWRRLHGAVEAPKR